MALKDIVNEGIKNAMKAKEEATLRGLRAIKAAIIVEETSGKYPNGLDAAGETSMLVKMVKQREDSVKQFNDANRPELAAKEQEEIAVIEQFLPKKLSAEELEAEVKSIIAEVGATTAQDLGKVMKVATPRLAGKADGAKITEWVRKLLS